ncbi:MAG: folate-binding protein [Proteobacteria bacterium]|jgi:folate-binding protein YgfZ|nr:folate-binding protein [Pseudomonadota bacterium]MDA1300616.1 folate-binding protein [Pseudomonadota bacterium]
MNTLERNLFRLSKFGFLAVTGRDAHKFIQGYTTCDVNKLGPDKHLGAICNLQGRMLTNFRIADIADGLLLRMHQDRILPTIAFLSKYIVFSKATLADVSDDWQCYGLIGDTPAPVEGEVHLTLPDGRTEIWRRSAYQDTSENTLIWDQQECAAGSAWISEASAEQFLPQMIGLHARRGIDFDKGCYLGQEIIARAQYRGALKRRLYRGTTAAPQQPGSTLMDATGKSIGMIIDVAGNDLLAVVQNTDDDTVDASIAGGKTTTLTLAIQERTP